MKNIMDLNQAEVAVTTQHLIDMGQEKDNLLQMSDFGDMGEFLCTCSELFPEEETPEYRYTRWEEIPDLLINREWLCSNFFEIREAMVEENIRFPVLFGNRKPLLAFDELINLLGIEKLLPRHPATLSGGESQRAALARALMGAEKLLIFDEPLASLDPKRRETFMDYIEATEKRIGIPVLYITHSEHETERLASRLLYIEDGVIREKPGDTSHLDNDSHFRRTFQ